MTNLENKLGVKEEELENNEIELVARNERYERVQVELGLLRGSLPDFMPRTSHYRTN